jgi:hypothetical protein
MLVVVIVILTAWAAFAPWQQTQDVHQLTISGHR